MLRNLVLGRYCSLLFLAAIILVVRVVALTHLVLVIPAAGMVLVVTVGVLCGRGRWRLRWLAAVITVVLVVIVVVVVVLLLLFGAVVAVVVLVVMMVLVAGAVILVVTCRLCFIRVVVV